MLPARRPRDLDRLQRRARPHSGRSASRRCSARAATSRSTPDASRARTRRHRRGRRARHGTPFDVESLADAFLRWRVARMANAMRELTLHHGQDPAQFALVRFGGAAGQHACAVAEALGIREILLHPLAGVLSAYGIGLAGRRVVRRGRPWKSSPRCRRTRRARTRCSRALARHGDARTAAARASPGRGRCSSSHRSLRLAGSDTDARCRLASARRRMRARVRGAHRTPVRIHAARRAAGRDQRAAAPKRSSATRAATGATARPQARGRRREVRRNTSRTPVARRRLARRADCSHAPTCAWRSTSQGPALLAEHGATSWIAPGWAGDAARRRRLRSCCASAARTARAR